MKSGKLQHHIELALSEGVFPASKLTVDSTTEACAAITTALRNKYTEYKFEAPTKLRDSVRESLIDYLESKKEVTKAVSVPSMNQALINQYITSGSKRQRPEDYTDNGSKVTAGGDGGGQPDSNGSGEGKVQSTSNQQQSQKRARKSSGHNGAGGAGRRSQAMITADATEGDMTSMIEGALGSNGREKPSIYLVARPPHRLSHLAGLDATIQQVKELTFLPIQQPQLYKHLGVSPPCGILLKGPSGCGKTSMANAIAGELALPYFRASGPELIGGTSGESEERIRDIFASAASKAPSVLFIDAIDVIAAKSDAAGQRGMERRVIAQLLDCIDALIAAGNNMNSDPSALNGSGADDGGALALKEASSDKDEGSIKSELQASSTTEASQGHVILLCATNKPDSLDATVRGRLSRELSLPVPDKASRSRILSMMTRGMRMAPDVDHDLLGQLTPGYVGADLQAVAREAGMIAVARIVAAAGTDFAPSVPPPLLAITSTETKMGAAAEKEVLSGDDDGAGVDGGDGNVQQEQEALVVASNSSDDGTSSARTPDDTAIRHRLDALGARIEMSDFRAALQQVQPSATREGFAVVPNVTWADVGALSEVRDELLHNLLEPIAHPERFRSLGLEVPAGVLFFGPPGCGKTLLAKAVANQSGANFISVKGPELLNMFVGESESRVRQVFSRARASAPCVIFFDELDALCPRRGSGEGGGGSNVTERVVNQLLTELDGLEARKDVYIIAATNRLELIDDAMLRPGRLGKLLYVPLPNAEDRVSILRALCRKVSLGPTTEEVKGDGEGDCEGGGDGKGEQDRIDLEGLMRDERAEGFSGADCAAFLREAGLAVMREWLHKHPLPSSSSSSSDPGTGDTAEWESPLICARHFEAAFGRSRPSVSEKDRRRYDMVHKLIKEGKPPIQALHIAATKTK